MSAKPIVVIYFPYGMFSGLGNENWIYEYMSFLNGDSFDPNKFRWHENKDYYKDYYWFCFYKDVDEPQLQVFYEKDFTPIQYEELKQLITNAIEQAKKVNHE